MRREGGGFVGGSDDDFYEKCLQVKLRLVRQETQMFNQEFWVEHNTAFKQGRENFINNLLAVKYPTEKDKKTLTSEEMSG